MLKFSLVGDLPYFSLLKNGNKMKFLILIAVPKCLTIHLIGTQSVNAMIISYIIRNLELLELFTLSITYI